MVLSELLIIFPIPSTPTFSTLSPHEPTTFDASSLSSIFVASQLVSTLCLELTFFVAFLLSSLTPIEVSILSSGLPLYSELVFSVVFSVSSLILTEGSILTSGLPLLSFPIWSSTFLPFFLCASPWSMFLTSGANEALGVTFLRDKANLLTVPCCRFSSFGEWWPCFAATRGPVTCLATFPMSSIKTCSFSSFSVEYSPSKDFMYSSGLPLYSEIALFLMSFPIWSLSSLSFSWPVNDVLGVTLLRDRDNLLTEVCFPSFGKWPCCTANGPVARTRPGDGTRSAASSFSHELLVAVHTSASE